MPATKKKKAATPETPEDLMRLINKEFGAGTMTMASDPKLVIDRIPTGILSIDFIIGGGVARNRHTEIFGSYSAGKTYTCLHTIATAQALGFRCCYVDVERSFDPNFAESIGVDLSELSYHKQRHGNQMVDFVELLLRSRQYDLIVIDSIAAVLPLSELEKSMEAGSYGTAQAKLMSAALRRLTTANENTALIWINQTREAVGTIFGNRQITSGGKAMGFYAGSRLEMTKIESIKVNTSRIDPKTGELGTKSITKGHRVLIRVEKDKTGNMPMDSSTFVFDYELGGIDRIEDLIYLGRRLGFVEKQGTTWWVEGYFDEKQATRNRFKSWLRRNKAVAEELEEWIVDYENTAAALTETETDEDEEDEDG
jgi:recombination protein RecA